MAFNEHVEGAVVSTCRLAHELGVAQPLVEPGSVAIPLVQTGLNIERLHGDLV
jgi:hypothetical protein